MRENCTYGSVRGSRQAFHVEFMKGVSRGNFMESMNSEKIYNYLQKWENAYKNRVLIKGINPRDKEILSANGQYKNKYIGKKCFVVGNGPSVNKINFRELGNELVITVNEMVLHKNFRELNSDFHFIADPTYLKLNRKNSRDIQIIEKMNILSESDTTLFCPIEAMAAVKRYGWNKKINIKFFASRLHFYDNYDEKFDFVKFIPAFRGVVQWGIAFAVFMGCKEIYLLGCDATNIIVDLSLFADENVCLDYAYELSKEVEEREKWMHRKSGLEGLLFGYWKIVHIFRELYLYCKKRGIQLYNCSEESILDCIPKRKFEDIF